MLRSPGALSFLDPLGPPMEQGRGADEIAAALQGDTPRELRLLEILDCGEMAVDERRVGQRPQVLGGLQLGRERGQEEQMEVLGDAQLADWRASRRDRDQHDLLRAGRRRRAWANASSSTSKRGIRRWSPDGRGSGPRQDGRS